MMSFVSVKERFILPPAALVIPTVKVTAAPRVAPTATLGHLTKHLHQQNNQSNQNAVFLLI